MKIRIRIERGLPKIIFSNVQELFSNCFHEFMLYKFNSNSLQFLRSTGDARFARTNLKAQHEEVLISDQSPKN